MDRGKENVLTLINQKDTIWWDKAKQTECKKREAIGKLHIDKTDWIGVTIINYTMLDFTMAIATSDCYQTSTYLFWLVQCILNLIGTYI